MSDNDSDSEDLFEDSLVTSTRACDGRTNTAIVDVQVGKKKKKHGLFLRESL